jgi:hypothetical protein
LILYRGTQTRDPKGRLAALSYTPSLPVAIIWSSKPGDLWGYTPRFLDSSTVHSAELAPVKILDLGDRPYLRFSNVLRLLRYEKKGGISTDTALEILGYLNRRYLGHAKGGEFQYKVVDEEGEPRWGTFRPFSEITVLSEFADLFEADESLDTADHLTADTFIFADAPALQEEATRQGFGAILYRDIFDGGMIAVPKLLGVKADILEGVELDHDFKREEVYTHDTYRPLVPEAITPADAVRTLDLLKTWKPNSE